jgi:hypothetical protein
MEGRNTLTAVIMVIAGAAYSTTSGPPSRAPASTPGAAGKANPVHRDEDENLSPWKTLENFKLQRPREADLEFLIAIVPDPFNTHLSLLFDRSIQSVQEAATAARYSVDRYWLPWQDNPYNATDKPDIRRQQEAEKSKREDEPGLILFRGDSKDLAVFLIGEAPTSGINVHAFKNALERIPASSQPVRVSGPTFSGSLPSLQAAIKDQKGRLFKVVSGTTTSTSAQREFKKSVDFRSTVHPDDMAGEAFFRYLDQEFGNRLAGPVTVAVLSEGDTFFGREFQKERTATNLRVLNFSFPRDISRLRNAYHDDFLANPVPEPYKTAPHAGIALTLKDPSLGHDNVPNFSQHTPLSQEATLLAIAAALRREEVEYAAIAATDPLDAFFLSRFLTTNCPNIRLYLVDADLLFVRPPESLPLVGMLSVTTYPLLVLNQKWSSKSNGRIAFSSRYSEGVYNATRSLLDESLQSLLITPLLGRTQPRGIRPSGSQPLAAGGYWPVALLARDRDRDPILLGPSSQTKTASASGPTAEDPGHLFFILVMVMTLLSAIIFFAIIVSAFRTRFIGARLAEPAATLTGEPPLLSQAAAAGAGTATATARERVSPEATEAKPPTPNSERIAADRAAYLLICTLSLAAISLCLAGPLWKLFPALDSFRIAIAYQIPSALILLVLLTAGYLTFTAGRANYRLTLAAWSVFAVAVAFGFHLLAPDESHRDFFMAYRSLQLASGLSPNIPVMLLFAAFAAWGHAHWQRRVLIDERTQRLPGLSAIGFGTHLKQTESNVGGLLEAGSMGWLAFGGAVLIWLMLSWWASITSAHSSERATTYSMPPCWD